MGHLSPKNLAKIPKSRSSIVEVILLLSLLGMALLFSARSASAEPQSVTYNGVTISPAIVKLTLEPGQASAPYDVMVTNNTAQPVTLNLTSVDFKALNNSGGLAFIDSTDNRVSNKHGLASWLNLGVPNLTLAPKQYQLIHMAVENREDLSPGGHYASVLFKGERDAANPGATHVTINQVVSMLVFVQKLGGEKYGVKLNPFKVGVHLFNLPETLNLTFKNTGNTQATPYGLVRIIAPGGHEVSRGQINTGSSLVLPDSERLFRTPLFKTGRAWLPGIYVVRTEYHIDGSSYGGVSSTKFLYLNIGSIAIASSLILLFGIVVWKSTNLLRSRRQNKKA